MEKYINILKQDYNGWDNQYKFFIDNLKNNIPFTYVRFNDGEMMGIDKIGSVAARGDQVINAELKKKLVESIKGDMDNYYVGIPCSKCFPKYHKLAKSLIKTKPENVVSAVALTNRNWPKFISEIGDAIKKPVIWISGNDQGVDNLKLLGIEVKSHHTFLSRNSWSKYEEIFKLIDTFKDGDIVFISLGPTSRVLAYEWFKLKPNVTFFDCGSIFDPFTRNIKHNCHKGWGKGFNKTPRCKNCN